MHPPCVCRPACLCRHAHEHEETQHRPDVDEGGQRPGGGRGRRRAVRRGGEDGLPHPHLLVEAGSLRALRSGSSSRLSRSGRRSRDKEEQLPGWERWEQPGAGEGGAP